MLLSQDSPIGDEIHQHIKPRILCWLVVVHILVQHTHQQHLIIVMHVQCFRMPSASMLDLHDERPRLCASENLHFVSGYPAFGLNGQLTTVTAIKKSPMYCTTLKLEMR